MSTNVSWRGHSSADNSVRLAPVVDFYRGLGFEADPEGIKVSWAVLVCTEPCAQHSVVLVRLVMFSCD